MISDMRHIKAFLAVARVGNFTRAAAELHVSQSALTVQIRQLEDTLGVRLFDRGKRRVALTHAGREVLVPLERILVDTEAIISRTRQLAGLRRGIVSLAVLPSLATQIVPAVLKEFVRLHPGVAVQIRDVLGEKIIDAVKKEEVDFGIGSKMHPDREVKASLLMVDKLCALVPQDHLLARQDSVLLSELTSVSLILTMRDSSIREVFEIVRKRERLSPTVAFETTNMATAIGLVRAGLGIAILPEIVARPLEFREVKCVSIIKPALERRIEILQKRDRSLSPAAAKMVEILRRHIAQRL
ncbi:MAG: LysR substrate-binding domain-containing protein [Candidatus Acidiferrales bacterium]